MALNRSSTNFKDWFKKIILLGQKDIYISFGKVYLSVSTHLLLLIIFYKLIELIYRRLGFSAAPLLDKIVFPTSISWWLFFGSGKVLTEKTISILVLVYGYMTLFVLIITNIRSIFKFALNGSN